MSQPHQLKFVLAILLIVSIAASCGAPAISPTISPPTSLPVEPTQPATAVPTTIPSTAIPAPPAINVQALSTDLDAMFQKITKANLFSGSVLVAQNGQVIFSKGYGFADRENKIPNTAQTKFRIGSLTKQFTAMAIMILQEQGKLHVEDKMCSYLKDCPDIWKPITIHQLLTHTSGIPDTFGITYTSEITTSSLLDQMIADAETKTLGFQPGEKFSYDNMGYILLGKIIEAVSGQSYETFLQKNIFEPLKMSSTGYDHNRDDLAIGYGSRLDVKAAFIDMSTPFAAGGLYSTVEDFYRWDQALYTDQLVPQKVLDTMFTAQVAIPDSGGWGYGYGWSIGIDNQKRSNLHYGGINGFASIIKRYPDDKATIIILLNQEDLDPEFISSLAAKKLFGE